MLLLILGFTLAPVTHKTEYTEAIGTASDTTITMTTGHTSASIDVEVNNSNGTFVSSSSPASSGSGTAGVTAEFGVTTNNVSGYTLSISGPDNTGKLIDSNNTDTTSNYISTLDLPSGTSSISASEFTNNTNYTNKWGYKPSKYNSTANSNFFPAPTTTATTLDKTSTPNASTANNYSIELGAKLDYTVSTGSYSKTFILTAVGNPVTYDITFADNTGDSTVDQTKIPARVTSSTSTTSVTLPSGDANIPTRTGYTFRAWCLGTVNTTGNVGTTCTGTEYNAGAEFPINQTTTNIVTLYATWTPNKYTCTKQYRLQNADDTWGSYNTEAEGTGASSTEQVDFGDTCSYSKSVADYKNSSDGTNNAQASTSGTMNSTNGITLSLSFYRNTYALTVDKNTTYISAASATTTPVYTADNNNYYRWGQDVSISATPASNSNFTTWSVTSGTPSGTFANATNATTTYTMPKGDSTIYAEGELNVVNELVNASSLQALTAAQCSNTTVGQTASLKDVRDDEYYLVGKLADGNCWLLDNLRLDLTSVTLAKLQGNTNAENQTLTYLKNGGGSSPYPSSGVSTSWSDSYNLPKINTGYKNTTTTSYGNGSGKIGVYYNYCAATAGSYCYASDFGTGNASQDICPKGWKMPAGNTAIGSYYYLYNTGYSANATNFINALSTPLSGYFYSGSPNSQGSGGRFWSSTQLDGGSMYGLSVNYSTVYPQNYHDRDLGYSVRCIFDPLKSAGINTMQDLGNLSSTDKAALVAQMTPNTNYTLTDARDGQAYTIARLTGTVTNSNYSQVWMTKNLNLAGGTALDSTTTDMPSDYTMPTANGFQTGNKLPNSSTSGFSSDTTAYVYNSNRTNCYYSPGCYSYYSWTAATLGSGVGVGGSIGDVNDGIDVTTASICPKGWRLPTSGNQTSGDANSWKKGDFYKLATAYGANLESNHYQNSGTFYNNAGPDTTVPNFLLAGYYYSGSFYNGGSYGYYWSSSSKSSTFAYNLHFGSSRVYSAMDNNRRYGFSVRCVLAE